jgi:hypothetical protein
MEPSCGELEKVSRKKVMGLEVAARLVDLKSLLSLDTDSTGPRDVIADTIKVMRMRAHSYVQ